MRKKKAFTLAEMIVVFIIVGIIASLGIATIKPWNRASQFAYSRIYNALSLAIYNHMVNSSDEFAFPRSSTDFCNALAEYMNVTENNCSEDKIFATNQTTANLNFNSDRLVSLKLPTYAVVVHEGLSAGYKGNEAANAEVSSGMDASAENTMAEYSQFSTSYASLEKLLDDYNITQSASAGSQISQQDKIAGEIPYAFDDVSIGDIVKNDGTTSGNTGNGNSISDFIKDRTIPQDPDISLFVGPNAQKPNLVLSNGIKLWIGSSNKNNLDFFTYTQNVDGTNDLVMYYIVYADLNGDRGPNTSEYRQDRLADIVAFAVTDHYTVIPLGYPAIDKRYLTAHVMYPSVDEEAGDEGEVPSDKMSYYEAIVQTFGTYNTSGNLDENRIVVANDIYSWDLMDKVFKSGSNFRVDDYSKYYTNQPEFNSEQCGDGKTISGSGDNKASETYCDIKIYQYH